MQLQRTIIFHNNRVCHCSGEDEAQKYSEGKITLLRFRISIFVCDELDRPQLSENPVQMQRSIFFSLSLHSYNFIKYLYLSFAVRFQFLP